MTNEKAVEILKEEIVGLSEDNPFYEAVDIAIKALETGEVYMTGKDYNLYLEGYKEGIKDYKEAIKSARQSGFNVGYEQGFLEGQKSRNANND